jgi:hypothetical protein
MCEQHAVAVPVLNLVPWLHAVPTKDKLFQIYPRGPVKNTSGLAPRRSFLGSMWIYSMLRTRGRNPMATKLRWGRNQQCASEKKKKRVIFSTDCSQSMGLQSVLKIRVKTSETFALGASPYKGSKPWVNSKRFVFSRYVLASSTRSRLYRVYIYSCRSKHVISSMVPYHCETFNSENWVLYISASTSRYFY